MKTDVLHFPSETYQLKERTVNTSVGMKHIVYREYSHIQYVAQPVNVEYQSLDVWEPITINGNPVNRKAAPILFVIALGGYMSYNNYNPAPPPPPIPSADESAPKALPGLGGEDGPIQYKNLALSYGYVVITPGCRGRECQDENGIYYGKAPMGLVDLKAAIRYIRYNQGVMPGDSERILAVGSSAGGAMSCLVAASANSPLFDDYLEEIGAADSTDEIFASASYSPIINLEHSDEAYEWQFGRIPCSGMGVGPIRVVPGLVDQILSAELKEKFKDYQDSLGLTGRDGYGTLSSDRLNEYILQYYLKPEASRYISTMDENRRKTYLQKRSWIDYENGTADFTFLEFLNYCGRMKGLPAFDDFNKKMAEPELFGTRTQKSRHFTTYSLQHDPSESMTQLSKDLQAVINVMNPMYFVLNRNESCANHWWIRHGAVDRDTSLPIIVDYATALENYGKDVNVRLIWDGGHCADDDPEGLLLWMLNFCN